MSHFTLGIPQQMVPGSLKQRSRRKYTVNNIYKGAGNSILYSEVVDAKRRLAFEQ